MSENILNNCPAPAKLNLFLHIVGRRADGYHLLQSVFQLIDHGDLLHFQVRSDGIIRRVNAVPGVAEEADLVVRAARLLQAHAGARLGVTRLGADITLEKRLPMGAGLGGGSSDAATTLMALNHLWQTGLRREQLMALGLRLGADIPFFLFGQNAFVEGIGEALSPVDTADDWFVVIEPGVAVPTPAIFSAKDLTRDSRPITIADFSSSTMQQQDRPHRQAQRFGRNDLQAVAARLFPPIADAIHWLSDYGDARMTGSGACVFCAFADQAEADAVLSKVPHRWRAWKAKAMAHHPLAHLLNRSGKAA